jgi:putative peptide zinc metalloprotease protein
VSELAAPKRTSALLLVPRNSADQARPALLLLPSPSGGAPQVVAIPPTRGRGSAWPFPFDPPPDAKPGDNRAMTVNTADGTAQYDVSFAVVWVSGGDVTQRNEAIALANCTNCTTVSVAFQAIFLLGQSDVVTPVNTSLAVNYNCRDCRTSAIAVQFVASLNALPDPETMARLGEIWRQLDQLAGQIPSLSDQEIVDRLNGIQSAILTVLTSAGSSIVDTADAAGGSGTAPSASPSPGATSGQTSTGQADTDASSTTTGSTSGTSTPTGSSEATASTPTNPTTGPSVHPDATATSQPDETTVGSGAAATPAPASSGATG